MPGKRGRPARISKQRRCGNCDDEHGAAKGKKLSKKKEVSEPIPEDQNGNAGDACQSVTDSSCVTQQELLPIVDEQAQTVTIFLVPVDNSTVASPVDMVNFENAQTSALQNRNLQNQGLVDEARQGSPAMCAQASNAHTDLVPLSAKNIDMESVDNYAQVSMRDPLLYNADSETANFTLRVDELCFSDDVSEEEALDLSSSRPAYEKTVESVENDGNVSVARKVYIADSEKVELHDESQKEEKENKEREENDVHECEHAKPVQEHQHDSSHSNSDDEEEDGNNCVEDDEDGGEDCVEDDEDGGEDCVEDDEDGGEDSVKDQDRENVAENHVDKEPATNTMPDAANQSSSDGWVDDDDSFLGDEYSLHDSNEDKDNDSQTGDENETLISKVSDCKNDSGAAIPELKDHQNVSVPDNSAVGDNGNAPRNSDVDVNDHDSGSHANVQPIQVINEDSTDDSVIETTTNQSPKTTVSHKRMPKFSVAENLMLCRFVCADYEFLLKRDKNEDVCRTKNNKWKYIGEKVSEIKKIRRSGWRCRTRFQQCRRLVIKMMEDPNTQDAEYNRWQELVRNTVRSMPKVARRFVKRPYRKRQASNPLIPNSGSVSTNSSNRHDQSNQRSQRDQVTSNLPGQLEITQPNMKKKGNYSNSTADEGSVRYTMADNARQKEMHGHGTNHKGSDVVNDSKVSDVQRTRKAKENTVEKTVQVSPKNSATTKVTNNDDSLPSCSNVSLKKGNKRQQSSPQNVRRANYVDSNVLRNDNHTRCRPSVNSDCNCVLDEGSDSGCGNVHSDSPNSTFNEDVGVARTGKEKLQLQSSRSSKGKSDCQAVLPYYNPGQLTSTACSGNMQIVPAQNREIDMTCKLLEVQQTTLQLLAAIAEGQKQMLDNQKGMLKEMKVKNKRRKHRNNYRQADSSDFED